MIDQIEPRLLLAADTFLDTSVSDYTDDPFLTNGMATQLDGFIGDFFDALETIEQGIDIGTSLDIDLTGLLDLEDVGDDPADTNDDDSQSELIPDSVTDFNDHNAVGLDVLLDIAGQLGESGLTEVLELDTDDTNPLDDLNAGTASYASILSQAFEGAINGFIFSGKDIDVLIGQLDALTATLFTNDPADAFYNTDAVTYQLDVDAGNAAIVNTSGDEWTLSFDFGLVMSRVDTFSYDLGRNADLLGFDYGSNLPGNAADADQPDVTLETFFRFDSTIAFDLTLTLFDAPEPTDDGMGGTNPTDGNVDDLQVSFDNNADLRFDAGAALSTGVAVGSTIENGVATDAATLASFNLRLGFLDIVGNADFLLNASASYDFGVDAGTLGGLTFDSNDLTLGGSFESLLTIQADLSNAGNLTALYDVFFPGGVAVEATLLLSADPFDAAFGLDTNTDSDDPRTAPTITFDAGAGAGDTNFADFFRPFVNITADGFISYLGQLRSFLFQFQNAPDIFGFDIPFGDAFSLLGDSGDISEDILDWAGSLETLLGVPSIFNPGLDSNLIPDEPLFIYGTNLNPDEIVPTFDTIQDLLAISEFDDILSGFLPTFDSLTKTLQFGFALENSAASSTGLTFDFNFGNLVNIGVGAGSSMSLSADLSLNLIFGFDLGGAAEVALIASEAALAVTSLAGNTPNINLGDTRFRLKVNGVPGLEVETEASATASFTTIDELVSYLQGQIDDAIAAATGDPDAQGSTALWRASEAPTFIVRADEFGRLSIATPNGTFLSITALQVTGGGFGDFGGFGFADMVTGDAINATSSVLPSDGVLTGTATFDVIVDGVSQTINLAPDNGNTGPGDLLDDLQAALDTAHGANTVLVVPPLTGDGAFRLVLADGNSSLRIDNTNDVARGQLGLSDDALSADVQIVGDRELDFTGGNTLALPTDGQLPEDAYIKVTIDATDLGGPKEFGPVTVFADNTDGTNGPQNLDAQDLIDDIRAALQTVEVRPGVTLAEFFDLSLGSSGELVVTSFFEPVDSVVIEETDENGDPVGAPLLINNPISGGLVQGVDTDGLFQGALDIVTFDVDVTQTADGTIVTQTFTLDDTTPYTSLSGVVDALNAQLSGNALDGIVSFGLNGGRIVIAGEDTSAIRSIQVSELSSAEASELGIQNGASAVPAAESGAFVADASFNATVTGSVNGSASADFGFLGIDINDIDGEVNASVSGTLRGDATLGFDNVNDLGRLFDAAVGLFEVPGDPTSQKLIDLIAGSPSGGVGITVGGSVDVGFGDIAVSGAGLAGADAILDAIQGELAAGLTGISDIITFGVGDITNFNPADLISLNLPSDQLLIDGFNSFLTFDFGDIQGAFDAALDFLLGLIEIDFLGTPLPFVGLTLSDALGISDAFDSLVDDIFGRSVDTVQGLTDALAAALELLGIDPGGLGLTYDVNSPGVLGFDLDFGRNFGGTLPLNFSLADLGLPSGFTDLANLSGSANLFADFGANIGLSLGIDITDPLGGLVINNDLTGIELTGVAEATNVSFVGALGPLAALVDGGFIALGGGPGNEIFSFDLAELAGVVLDLDDIVANGFGTLLDDIKATIDGSQFDFNFDAVLPIFVQLGGQSVFIGNLAFEALVDSFEDLGFFLDPGGFVGNFEDIFQNLQLPSFDVLTDVFGADFLDNLGLLDTIQLFVEGVDLALGSIGDLFTGELLGLPGLNDIPLVGDAFDDAAAFIDDIRNDLIAPLANLIDQTPEFLENIFGQILNTFEDALGVIGQAFAIEFLDEAGNRIATLTSDAVNAAGDFIGNIEDILEGGVTGITDFADLIGQAFGFQIALNLGDTYTVAVGDVDFGVPAFGLSVDEDLELAFKWALAIGLGVNLDDGFFLALAPGGGDEVSLEAALNLPDGISLTLGFLKATVTNASDPDPTPGDLFDNPEFNDLYGVFAFNINDPDLNDRLSFAEIPNADVGIEFGVAVDLMLDLTLGFGGLVPGGAFPSLEAGFGFQWGFGTDPVSAGLPDMPEIEFKSLDLLLGDFLTDVLGPVIDFVQTYIDPILPLINLLVDPIPVISDLNGEISLLDIAAAFGLVNDGLVTAIEIIVDIVNSLNDLDVSGEQLALSLIGGGPDQISQFIFGGDGGTDLTNPANASIFSDPTQTFDQIIAGLGDFSEIAAFLGGSGFANLLSGVAGTGGQAGGGASLLDPMSSASSGTGLVFPWLEDPGQVFGLLFGRDATLIGLDLPQLVFGFDYSQFFSIWGPIGVTLGGAFSATFDFDVAYDTAGIRRFADGGFQNPLDLFDGFYFLDDSFENPGVDTPEITLYGEITAALAINIGIASAGVGGGIFGTFEVDWADPDGDLRMRFSEIAAQVVANDGNILCIFDYRVFLEAKLFVFVEALFGLWEKRWDFGPSLPLIDEMISCTPDPILASNEDGILRLNMGEFAAERQFDDGGNVTLEDVDEQFFVYLNGSNEIIVEAIIDGQTVNAQNYGAASQYDLILGRAGIGNDAIYLDGTGIAGAGVGGAIPELNAGDNPLTADLTGGIGNDTLVGSSGMDLILGEEGDDLLRGGAGADLIRGGTGNDRLKGEGGNDTLTGGLGNDVLDGGADDDTVDAGEGDDIVAGGDGNDVLFGREGNDTMSGGGGSDIIAGGVGLDVIWGDIDLDFNANCEWSLGDGFIQDGTDGTDYIAGGEGDDWVSADGADDFVWGDADFDAINDSDTDPNTLNTGLDIIIGDSGTGTPGLTATLVIDDSPVSEGGTGVNIVTAAVPRTIIVGLNKGGADTLSGGGGNDVLLGDEANDRMLGDRFDALLDTNDLFEAGLATDVLNRDVTAGAGDLGEGDDVLVGFRGADAMFGNGADDWLFGGSGTDFVVGNDGGDTLRGAAGRDVIFGDDASIVLFDAGDTDRYVQQDSGDPASYQAQTFDPFELATANPTVGGADFILGGVDDDIIFGGLDADTIDGQGGNELIFGDHGTAQFTYNSFVGISIMTLAFTTDPANGGNDMIEGGLGRDIILAGTANDTINGDLTGDEPQSDDVILGDFGELSQVISLRLLRGFVAEINTVAGSLGDTGATPAAGDYGNDTATGGGGADVIFGGLGMDILVGGDNGMNAEGENRDIVVGDDGRLSYVEAGIIATVAGQNLIGDNDHADVGEIDGPLGLTLDIVETVVDVAAGDADTISGGNGDDLLLGGGGGDLILGDDDWDVANAVSIAATNPGVDIIVGDQGVVALTNTLVRVVRSTAVADSEGGGDTVRANEFDDVVIGGVSNGATDSLAGEEGDDMILGDEGVVLFTWDLNLAIRDRIFSTSFTLGGDDVILGNQGDDIGIGGSGSDRIAGDNEGGVLQVQFGDDLLIGDQGEIDYDVSTGVSLLDTVDSTDTADADGGIDTIEGDSGADIVIGGVLGDLLYGDSGDRSLVSESMIASFADVVLGDEGTVFYRDERPEELLETPGNAPDSATIDRIVATDETLGGADVIGGGRDGDVLIGGVDADRIFGDNNEAAPFSGTFDQLETKPGDDIAIGDQGELIFFTGLRDVIQTTDTTLTDGGADTIEGNDGEDLILGGVEGDSLYGEAAVDSLIGSAGDFDDVILGDEGEILYREFDTVSATIDVVRSTQFDGASILGGNDLIFGNKGSDIAIGGTGSDTVHGDNLPGVLQEADGDDILIGDQGEVLNAAVTGFLDFIRTTDIEEADGGVDTIEGDDGNDIILGGTFGDVLHGENDTGLVEATGTFDDIILGDEGFVDYDETNGASRELVQISTQRDTNLFADINLGGSDDIYGNRGSDIALGGTLGDMIRGDVYRAAGALIAVGGSNSEEFEDILVGDFGQLLFDDLLPFEGVIDANTSFLSVLETIDPGEGGDDFITGDDDDDIILGGFADDRLYGEHTFDRLADLVANRAGDDIMLGDNGRLDYGLTAADGAPVDPFGNLADPFDGDLATLDLVQTTNPTLGGDDVMFGNGNTVGGGDIVIGGTGSDLMWGDSGDGLFDNRFDELGNEITDVDLGGGTGVDGADGNDLMMGDNGLVFVDAAITAAVDTGVTFNRFFLTIDIGFVDGDADQINDLGDSDMMFGNGANDIMLGQQGDDVMFGGAGDDDLTGGHNVATGVDEQDALEDGDFDNGGTTDFDPTDADDINDVIDGGLGADVIAGDNAIIIRQTDSSSPRFRQVGAGGEMYVIDTADFDGIADNGTISIDEAIRANVQATAELNPRADKGRTFFMLDHSASIQEQAELDAIASAGNEADPQPFGNDILVGNLGDDEMWGGLGDDIMQGDGLIQLGHTSGAYDPTQGADQSFNIQPTGFLPVAPTPAGFGALNVDEVTEFALTFRVLEDAASDGDDYMEGNGGNDRMYGNLGQDDMIGGSSSLFGLGTLEAIGDPARPDGADLMYGSIGRADRLERNADAGDESGFDSDVMLGDNANIYRLVDANGDFEEFNYDLSQDRKIIPRPVDLLDYGYQAEFVASGANGPEFRMLDLLALTGTIQPGAGDLMYGEAGDDFMWGQTGDDVLFGNAQNDAIIGNRGNDIIFGGTGEDGILGDDGLLRTSRVPSDPGSQGNTPIPADVLEPLWGIADLGIIVNQEISTPGNLQRAIINVADELRYQADLVAFRIEAITNTEDLVDSFTGQAQGFNDIIFGGLATDWIHGGDGDDGISGAEALAFYYSADGTDAYNGGANNDFAEVNSLLQSQQEGDGNVVLASQGGLQDNPFWFGFALYNPGELLRHEGKQFTSEGGNGNFTNVTAEFAAYDSFNPRDRVFVDPSTGISVPIADLDSIDGEIEFILNFSADEGVLEADRGAAGFPDPDGLVDLYNDGDDRIFGDLGNDWIVGGTGRDHMYGGRGNDLLNMDDDHDTNGGLNDDPDAYQAYADIAYGGAGRDVLILNTGADRAIDWVGEFNSYIVPFSPFGAFHISRSLQPQLADYLYDLSESDGADRTTPDAGLFLVHKTLDVKIDDPDPLRNFEPFGELGMVRQPDYDWGEQTGAPADPQAGNLQGKREIMRRALFADEPLQGGGGGNNGQNNGNAQGFAPLAGTWEVSGGTYNVVPPALDQEAASIFFLSDAQPTYMEILATVNAEKDKQGWWSNGYIVFDYQSETDFKYAGINAMTDKIEIGHRTADGWVVLTNGNMQLRSDRDYDLTLVMHGTVATIYVNGGNAVTHNFEDALNDGYIGLGANNSRVSFDNWQVQKLPPVITFEYEGTQDLAVQSGAFDPVTGLISGGAADAFAVAAGFVEVALYSMLEIEATVDGDGLSGIVFDYYGPDNFKFAGVDAASGQVVIGHVTSKGMTIDATADVQLTGNGGYTLKVHMLGGGVSVELDGTAVAGHVFAAILNDGMYGVFADGDGATVSEFAVRGDDPALQADEPDALTVASAAAADPSTATSVSTENLQALAAEALSRWAAELGIAVEEIGLRPEDFVVADLPDGVLGAEADGTIYIDDDGAGFGWFVDETPGDDVEFADGAEPDGVDLLSVLMHEIGHHLGFEHGDSAYGDVLDPTISEGERFSFSGDSGYVFDDGSGVEDGGAEVDWEGAPAASLSIDSRPDYVWEDGTSSTSTGSGKQGGRGRLAAE